MTKGISHKTYKFNREFFASKITKLKVIGYHALSVKYKLAQRCFTTYF